MKLLASIAIAAAVAAGSATGASAGGWGPQGPYGGPYSGPYHGPYHKPHVVYRSGPDAGGALLAGAFLGLAFGAIASQQYAPQPEPEPVYLPPPHPNFAAADAHFAWCTRTYQSYNAERDSFIDFQGIERPCVDPYQQP